MSLCPGHCHHTGGPVKVQVAQPPASAFLCLVRDKGERSRWDKYEPRASEADAGILGNSAHQPRPMCPGILPHLRPLRRSRAAGASEQGFEWLCLGPGHTARKDRRQGLFLRALGYHQELRVAGQLTEPRACPRSHYGTEEAG